MGRKKVTIELSDGDYGYLANIAQACHWTLEEVVVQCIRAGMPPTLSKVPDSFYDELIKLNAMSDRDLMRIADGQWPPPENQDDLHRKADFTALRRTYALSLLKWRGHPISPDETMFG